MLDFRVGSRKETRNLSIKAKRDLYTYTLPNLIGKATLKGSLVKEAVMINSDDKSDQDKQVQDLPYVFTPNKMPVQKQLFYQLCDLHDPEIQRLISLNDGQVSGTRMNLSTSETLVSNNLIGSIRQNHRSPSMHLRKGHLLHKPHTMKRQSSEAQQGEDWRTPIANTYITR